MCCFNIICLHLPSSQQQQLSLFGVSLGVVGCRLSDVLITFTRSFMIKTSEQNI